jgi:hypothetical protein
MIIANRFGPAADYLLWGFDSEPPVIDLEDALYRVLFEFRVTGVGGVPSPLGAGRAYILGAVPDAWRNIVETTYKRSGLVLMVPHQSEGVAWELDFLLGRDGLVRALLVTPPELRDLDASAIWSGATALFAFRGCKLPAYTSAGMLIMLGRDREIARQWRFDLVWRAELTKELMPLLPHREAESTHAPQPRASDPALRDVLVATLSRELGGGPKWSVDDEKQLIRIQSDAPLPLPRRLRVADIADHYGYGVLLEEAGSIAIWHPRRAS